MARTGDMLVRKLCNAYGMGNVSGLQPYLKQLLTTVPPNGCGRMKIMSTCGGASTETALFRRKKNRLVPVESIECLDPGAYVAATPELARLGWHAGSDALNWKYHVWSVGTLEGVKLATKYGFLGYINTGFMRRLRRSLNGLPGARVETVGAVGHSPISLKFISDLSGKSISKIRSCLHLCGKSAGKADDASAKLLPVKYSFYFDLHEAGREVRADIWLMVASQEVISGKGARELDKAIWSMRNRIGAAIHRLLEFAEIIHIAGILGNAEKKAQQPAKAED